jgi:hypothetical protein
MDMNNNITNRNLMSKKVEDVNKVNTYAVSEIGFPNNKDKGKGKKGGIVGKG